MKKNIIIAGLLIATIGLSSCKSNESKENQEVKTDPPKEVASPTSSNPVPSVEEIDSMRAEIESLQIEPVEVSTSGLREKTRQKWSKIHFYVQNDIVVRVKTYPHPEITKRTEEFYANEDGLLLVVIEDNGEGAKGKPKNELDKMYYFNNGQLINESKKAKVSEYTIKESDAEELLSEFNEYLEIYKEAQE